MRRMMSLLVLGGLTVVPGLSSSRPARMVGAPSPEAVSIIEGALAALAVPTSAQALPGSHVLTRGLMRRPGSCAEALVAYRAAGAPVPENAILTEALGTLLLNQPYARSAVLFTDDPAGCRYRIVDEPTLVLEGPPEVPRGSFFTRVACSHADSIAGESLVTEVLLEAGPHTLVVEKRAIDGSGKLTVGYLVPGRLVDRRGPPPAGAGWRGTASLEVMPALDRAVASIRSESGDIAIQALCTDNGFELVPPQIAGP